MLRKATYYTVHNKSEYNNEFWPHGGKGPKIIELYTFDMKNLLNVTSKIAGIIALNHKLFLFCCAYYNETTSQLQNK